MLHKCQKLVFLCLLPVLFCKDCSYSSEYCRGVGNISLQRIHFIPIYIVEKIAAFQFMKKLSVNRCWFCRLKYSQTVYSTVNFICNKAWIEYDEWAHLMGFYMFFSRYTTRYEMVLLPFHVVYNYTHISKLQRITMCPPDYHHICHYLHIHIAQYLSSL